MTHDRRGSVLIEQTETGWLVTESGLEENRVLTVETDGDGIHVSVDRSDPAPLTVSLEKA